MQADTPVKASALPVPDLRWALEVPFLDAVRGSRTRITLPDGGAIEVQIPQGSADGRRLRLRGKGGVGLGDGPPGHAYVTLVGAPAPRISAATATTS